MSVEIPDGCPSCGALPCDWVDNPYEKSIAHPPAAGDSEAGRLREAMAGVRSWAASLTVTDMNEIVADGGITAGMVVGQEAIEQVRRLDAALAGSEGGR